MLATTDDSWLQWMHVRNGISDHPDADIPKRRRCTGYTKTGQHGVHAELRRKRRRKLRRETFGPLVSVVELVRCVIVM